MIIVQGFLAQLLKRVVNEKKMAIGACLALVNRFCIDGKGASFTTCYLAPSLGFVLLFSVFIASSAGFLAPALGTLVTLTTQKETQGLIIGVNQAFCSAAA